MVHTVVKINIHEIHKFHQAYNYAMARIQSHLIWLDPHFVEAIKYSIWQERNWTQDSLETLPKDGKLKSQTSLP